MRLCVSKVCLISYILRSRFAVAVITATQSPVLRGPWYNGEGKHDIYNATNLLTVNNHFVSVGSWRL